MAPVNQSETTDHRRVTGCSIPTIVEYARLPKICRVPKLGPAVSRVRMRGTRRLVLRYIQYPVPRPSNDTGTIAPTALFNSQRRAQSGFHGTAALKPNPIAEFWLAGELTP